MLKKKICNISLFWIFFDKKFRVLKLFYLFRSQFEQGYQSTYESLSDRFQNKPNMTGSTQNLIENDSGTKVNSYSTEFFSNF